MDDDTQARNRLLTYTALRLGGTTGRNNDYGYGLIDALVDEGEHHVERAPAHGVIARGDRKACRLDEQPVKAGDRDARVLREFREPYAILRKGMDADLAAPENARIEVERLEQYQP